MKYYITEELKIQASTRDYQFTCDGCHIALIVNDQVNFVLYNMDNTIVKDIHTLLPINGTVFPNINSEYYINPGTYKLNIGQVQQLQGVLQYQKQVDSNDINYKLLDDVSTDISAELANNAYPVKGRLCTVEDMFAEYHENNSYYDKGYYLAEHVKDKLVTYDDAINGLSIKLLSVYGYETLMNQSNPASYIYKINPNISEEEQTPPDSYFDEILKAIKEWTLNYIDNDKIWKITKDTNIYEILTFTLTNRKDGKTPTLETSTLSSISDDVRFNKTLTVQHGEIFDKVIGNDRQGNIPGSLWDLLKYISSKYQFMWGNQRCTLFPNQYNYTSDISNNMRFINVQGIIQNGVLQYEFQGHGPVLGKNKVIQYGIIDMIEQTGNGDTTFTISHSYNPFTSDHPMEETTSFYDNKGNSVLTVQKLYDIIYVHVWKKIISDLVYNTVTFYTTPFNGSQIYNTPNKTGEDAIRNEKVVRICDLANITFKLYGVSDAIYPWYISTDNDIKTYINKRLFMLDIVHPETNKFKTLLPNASPYTYYNAHTFSPEWKKLRGSNTLNIEYVQYSKVYDVSSNTQDIKIYPVASPVTYIKDPDAKKAETQSALNELGLTLNADTSTGIYGAGNNNDRWTPDDRVDDDDRYPGRDDDNNSDEPNTDPHNNDHNETHNNPTTPSNNQGNGGHTTQTNPTQPPTRNDTNEQPNNSFGKAEHRTLIDPDDLDQYTLEDTNKTKVGYYAVLPTTHNLTPNIKNILASLSLYSRDKAMAPNTHSFIIQQYPRQYLVLFIFYKPLSGGRDGVYGDLTQDDVQIDENSGNFKIDFLGKGTIPQGKIVDYHTFYQLFNIKYAYKDVYNINFNINIKKTTEELKSIHYKVGVYYKSIDDTDSLKDDARYVYDISTYINNDNTLKIDRNKLSNYTILVDPTLAEFGEAKYNKISINGNLPQEAATYNMASLWPNNNSNSSVTAKVTIKLTNNTQQQ